MICKAEELSYILNGLLPLKNSKKVGGGGAGGFGIQTSTFTEGKATLIFFGSTGVLNVKTYVFVGLITPFLRTLTSRITVTLCSLKFSMISLSLQGRSSEQRMTPLEELKELCNDILTLRSNILVVFSRFSTCCFLSTSNSRAPDFSFLIVFG